MRSSAAVGVSQRVTPYELFILALSIWAILGLAAQSTFGLSAATAQILDYADLCVCAVFLMDFGHSLNATPDRWRYLRTWGWLDLLSSIPAVDALRWGRTARILRILRVLRGLKSARAIIRFVMQRRSQSAFLAAVLLCLALLTTSSIAILQFEVAAGGNIQTAQDAVWWSLSWQHSLRRVTDVRLLEKVRSWLNCYGHCAAKRLFPRDCHVRSVRAPPRQRERGNTSERARQYIASQRQAPASMRPDPLPMWRAAPAVAPLGATAATRNEALLIGVVSGYSRLQYDDRSSTPHTSHSRTSWHGQHRSLCCFPVPLSLVQQNVATTGE